MRTNPAASKPPLADSRGACDQSWRERAGRLFAAFERPAKAMVRRGFRGAFSPDEIDDIYAGAWVGTLRSLATRHQGLEDEEIRSYVLTAVANQASKELRRRRRKPTAPLELVGSVADTSDAPEERLAGAERSRMTRDLLVSLPPRRRAVILLRYGWGLEPSQICGLVEGLSPRAYRKEITRGVDEVTEKMRALESGDWCRRREPILKAYVAGAADADQERQARAHLAHCRDCGEFVSRLRGHLHDLGGAAMLPAAVEGLDGHLGAVERLAEAGDRARELGSGLLARVGSAPAEEGAAQVIASGGARGAGAAGAGVLAKFAGIGTAGKLAAACLGGGAAATACIAAGVVPVAGLGVSKTATAAQVREQRQPSSSVVATPAPATLPTQAGDVPPQPQSPGTGPAESTASSNPQADGGAEAGASPPPDPVAPETPPVEQEFGVAPAAAPVSPEPAAAAPATGGGGGGDEAAVREEFAP